jgi:cysteine desulfurase
LIASCTNLAFSAGSACTSATMSASHVLQAMGLSNEQANSSVRISFGRFTTEKETITAAKTIKLHVERLRELSPLWKAP